MNVGQLKELLAGQPDDMVVRITTPPKDSWKRPVTRPLFGVRVEQPSGDKLLLVTGGT